MSKFLDSLLVEHYDGADWRVASQFRYQLGDDAASLEFVDADAAPGTTVFRRINNPIVITVPADFLTDFASIPRIFHWLYSPTGPWGKAAVIHDYLYQTGIFTKRVADAIFYDGMLASGVPWWRRWIMFKAVVWFGGKAWNAHRRANLTGDASK